MAIVPCDHTFQIALSDNSVETLAILPRRRPYVANRRQKKNQPHQIFCAADSYVREPLMDSEVHYRLSGG